MHRVVSDYTGGSGGNNNVKVFVRARPPEEAADTSFLSVSDDNRKITIKDPDVNSKKYSEVAFQFDRIFWTETKQKELFDETCQPLVDHVIEGYNCCCFAYGQTGSGKTYSMFGEDGEIRGMIPRSVEYLFDALAKRSSTNEIAMVCTFLEIYNDAIRDLGKSYLVAMGAESSSSASLHVKTSDLFASLSGKRGNSFYAPAFKRQHQQLTAQTFEGMPALKAAADEYQAMNYDIREDTDGNVFVKDLSLVPVTTMEEVMSLIASGLRIRATHETKMNSVSSRSHTVFTVTIVQKDKSSGQTISGMLNLVDLAGSERLKKSESVGVRLKEALHINTSLTALGKVVMSLDPNSDGGHIPYRDSKLTRVLQNSLGGNSHTTLLATVTPIPRHYEECLSSLQFANRCRNVVNNPRVNYVGDAEDKDKKIKRLMDELHHCRMRIAQLETTGGAGFGKSSLTPSKLIDILQKLGVKAALGPDGGIVIDGKKVAAEALGIAPTDAEEESVVDTVNGSVNPGAVRFASTGGTSRNKMNVDKMKKYIADLELQNKELLEFTTESKHEHEMFTKKIANAHAELAKFQTKAQHKEYQLKTLLAEKDTYIAELKKSMKETYDKDVVTLVNHNNEILKQQHDLLNKYPESVREYTTFLKNKDERNGAIERQLRATFSAHLQQLEQSKQAEMANTKQQYEHWIKERDANLAKFIDGFNRYRTNKSNQLRACEKEIICLYEYTLKLEKILHDCEAGKYPVMQKQVGSSGRPTTGLLMHDRTGGVLTSDIKSKSQKSSTPYGGMSIPKAIKPPNPLTTALAEAVRATSSRTSFSSSVSAKSEKNKANLTHLELSKRILHKHIDRQNKMGSSTAGANVINEMLGDQNGPLGAKTSTIDTDMQQHIMQMLNCAADGRDILPVPSNLGSSRGVVRPQTGRKPVDTQAVTVKNLNAQAKYRPASANAVTARKGENNASSSFDTNNASFINVKQDNYAIDTITSNDAEKQAYLEEINTLQSEIENLKQARHAEQLQMEHIVEELQSNETWKYMSHLEQERERMQEQIYALSQQIHSAKVANDALSRGNIATASGRR